MGVTKALEMQERTGHKLIIAQMQGGKEKEKGGLMVYCRACGMYTSRNCRGLKEECPRNMGTRCTWAVRMGKDKRHPTEKSISIVKEWDVAGIRSKWKSEEEAVRGLREAMEHHRGSYVGRRRHYEGACKKHKQ